ncbi:hypothetical protein L1987_57343 [Smallanthus sonchifolius]|uniref:Uncharacterized protein n=1 Tax=Smallanthus sonchifolius TaxID=185202 RepID=A0ACB9DDC4_9ASTR|nr:hypothetical protein L1987_57343 [Smallanthus sonchifolius]
MECRRKNLPTEHLDVCSEKYLELRMDLMRSERHLWEPCFTSQVEHPHKFILNYIATPEIRPELRQEAWNLACVSLHTTLCVRFKSAVVAGRVVYVGAVLKTKNVARIDAQLTVALLKNTKPMAAIVAGMKGFPAIKACVPGKPSLDYQGETEVKHTTEFALKQVKALLKSRLRGKTIGGLGEKSELSAPVEPNSEDIDFYGMWISVVVWNCYWSLEFVIREFYHVMSLLRCCEHLWFYCYYVSTGDSPTVKLILNIMSCQNRCCYLLVVNVNWDSIVLRGNKLSKRWVIRSKWAKLGFSRKWMSSSKWVILMLLEEFSRPFTQSLMQIRTDFVSGAKTDAEAPLDWACIRASPEDKLGRWGSELWRAGDPEDGASPVCSLKETQILWTKYGSGSGFHPIMHETQDMMDEYCPNKRVVKSNQQKEERLSTVCQARGHDPDEGWGGCSGGLRVKDFE